MLPRSCGAADAAIVRAGLARLCLLAAGRSAGRSATRPRTSRISLGAPRLTVSRSTALPAAAIAAIARLLARDRLHAGTNPRLAAAQTPEQAAARLGHDLVFDVVFIDAELVERGVERLRDGAARCLDPLHLSLPLLLVGPPPALTRAPAGTGLPLFALGLGGGVAPSPALGAGFAAGLGGGVAPSPALRRFAAGLGVGCSSPARRLCARRRSPALHRRRW